MNSPQIERRRRSADLVEKLRNERTEMLVLFCRVAGLEPYSSHEPAGGMLQEFCQVLVDYVAAGHFALYERIVNQRERRAALVKLAENVYPQIAGTTDAALAFNETYAGAAAAGGGFPDSLWTDLSQLGEALAQRIELEDRLINALQLGVAPR